MTTTVEVPYIPHGAHRALFMETAPLVVFDGPKGTGKTRAACEKGVALAEANPGAQIIFLRRYREWLSGTVLPMLEGEVFTPKHPALRGASATNRSQYEFPNGSVIYLRGFDKPEKFNSGAYDYAVVFEATECDEASVRILRDRMRNFKTDYQQVVLDCNPKGPRHWIARQFMEQRQGVVRLPSTHRDNPKWWDREKGDWTREGRVYVLQNLGGLEGVDRARNLEGQWVQAQGMIYDCFTHDRNVCVRDRAEFRRFSVTVDDGVTDPFAALEIGYDHDGRMHVFAERYSPGLDIPNKIAAVDDLGGRRARVTYDNAAAVLGLELCKVFRDCQPCDKVIKSVVEGCKLVRQRMLPAADGRPRLTVDPGCVNLLEELDSYAWKVGRDGTVVEEPEDRHNHALDALRYEVVREDATRASVFV